MKAVQPEMANIRERYADDKDEAAAGADGSSLQEGEDQSARRLPSSSGAGAGVLLALQGAVSSHIEMRHAPFYGWIKDLSASDPTNIFNAVRPDPVRPDGAALRRPVPPSRHLADHYGHHDVCPDEAQTRRRPIRRRR